MRGDIGTIEDILLLLRGLGPISLFELDVQDYEWTILTRILDSGILQVSGVGGGVGC